MSEEKTREEVAKRLLHNQPFSSEKRLVNYILWERAKATHQERERWEKECEKQCYCRNKNKMIVSTFFSDKKDGKEYCPFCWLKKQLKNQEEIK